MTYVENLKTFVRVYELGSMSAAARDLNISPAVSSSRISELEKHLSIRLFNRTTRNIKPTQQGELFYRGAVKILDTINEVECSIADISTRLKGTIFVSAPLGLGKKLIAPLIPLFRKDYPDVTVRLRLSDRNVDVTNEGLDAAFVLGVLADSNLRIKTIHELSRLLCAAPSYIETHGNPENLSDLQAQTHRYLPLRFPGSADLHWVMQSGTQTKRIPITSTLDSDDGDVLTTWALQGEGIINKPLFEVAKYIENKQLVPVLENNPPVKLPFSCVYPHKRLQDPKVRLFIDFVSEKCKEQLASY